MSVPYISNLPSFPRGELSAGTSMGWGGRRSPSPLGSNTIAPVILGHRKAGHRERQAMGILLRPPSYIVSADSLGIEHEEPGMQS